ncbi:MAG TPA: cytochrome-c oxidase, cbb3-type subunit II, partial [Candidatus Xenobia bacterium]
HNWLETKGALFAVLAVVAVSIGGLVEIIPLYRANNDITPIATVKPYTPLEIEGRDIYIREGCYLCHSQQVRPFRDETERYGPYAKAGEFVYDHPFQWGSKRIGPDLERVGGKYPNAWHYVHMRNPRDVTPDSIMPTYQWLHENPLDSSDIQHKMQVLREVGVPYTDEDIKNAPAQLQQQAQQIADSLRQASISDAQPDREIVALIAYLQRLGTDIHWREGTP